MVTESAPSARTRVAGQMADAAQGWLDLLDDEQRVVAAGARPSEDASDDERRRWFYTPTDHGGLTFHQQRPGQQQAAMRLVASGLSPEGFVTVAAVIGLENVLDRDEGFTTTSDRARTRRRDVGLYYLRVFGEPGGDRPWGWRFGGHHVSLNNLVVDGELVSTTPCFLGANPARSALLGGGINRPLGQVEDLARELVRSLPDELTAHAVLAGAPPPDIVTGNRGTVLVDDPALATPEGGVAGGDLDRTQREILRALLSTYFDRVPSAVSPMSAYDDDALDAVRFAWVGSTEAGRPHYYRLLGPNLLAEWDNTQRDGNHAHSVWRDPSSDFGLDVLAAHRTRHH
jgi:hypothetical protein